MAAPAMLTLGSGAARAMNSCDRVNLRIDAINDKIDQACATTTTIDDEGNEITVVQDEDACNAARASLAQANASLGDHYCIN